MKGNESRQEVARGPVQYQREELKVREVREVLIRAKKLIYKLIITTI